MLPFGVSSLNCAGAEGDCLASTALLAQRTYRQQRSPADTAYISFCYCELETCVVGHSALPRLREIWNEGGRGDAQRLRHYADRPHADDKYTIGDDCLQVDN